MVVAQAKPWCSHLVIKGLRVPPCIRWGGVGCFLRFLVRPFGFFWKWGKISCRGIKADVFIRLVWDSKILNSFCPNFLSIPVQTRNAQKVWDFFAFFLRQENQKSLYLLIKVSFLFVCFRFLFKYSQRPWDCMCMPQHKKKVLSVSVCGNFSSSQPGTSTKWGTTRQDLGNKKNCNTPKEPDAGRYPGKGLTKCSLANI